LTLAAPTFTFASLHGGRERSVMSRRIVFVCTGNSCRSPLAEVLARRRYADLPLHFASAGTSAAAGEPASAGARAVAHELGLDLDAHRSAPLDASALAGADWVIGLTRTHAALVGARTTGAWPGAVGLLAAPGHDWRRQGPLVAGGDLAGLDVADPWQQDLDVYRRTAGDIDAKLAEWIGVFRELCAGRDCRS
jgi:protein-tyrosine-phosphatase